MITPILILSLLALPLAVACLAGRWHGRRPDVERHAALGLALAFLFFATGHFALTDDMVRMLPPWVPGREPLVYATGVLEILIAAGLLVAKTRRSAAIAAMVVFVAFFPANVYAAWNGVGTGGHQWGPVYLFIRLPLQLVLLAWTYFLCLRRSAR